MRRAGRNLPRVEQHISEAERERRLRSQEGQELLPPPHLVALLAAQIAPHRQNDALVAWQSARKRTAEESIEAAEDLFYLTNIFSNQYLDAKDWSRHRAMTESTLEVFFLPRHRAVMISTMYCGACRENDLVAAERWLALLDPDGTGVRGG